MTTARIAGSAWAKASPRRVRLIARVGGSGSAMPASGPTPQPTSPFDIV
jgi:hypothetical protein